MEVEALGASFLEWVNTFEGLSKRCSSLSELADGVVLSELLSRLDPEWFAPVRAEASDNWVPRFNNLKKLSKLITRYYEEGLGKSLDGVEAPNLTAVAKGENDKETLKLCQLVLALAVHCPSNQDQIAKIQSLNKESQHGIMNLIERVMQQLAGDDVQGAPEDHALQVRNLAEENEELARAHHNLSRDFEELKQQYQYVISERDQLALRLKDVEHKASEGAGADFLLKTEIDRLKLDLERSEAKTQDTETFIERQAAIITDLNRKVDDLTKRAGESDRLKDEIEEYRHAADKLQKTEGVIEKYKKKLEESADLCRQIKTLEEQNHVLHQRNQHIEEEYRKVISFKSAMDTYKDQVSSLESKNSELRQAQERLEFELNKAKDKLTKSELDRERAQDDAHHLEEKLRDLELNGSHMDISHAGGLADALSGESKDNLKQKILRLEQELERFRSTPADSDEDGRVAVLQSMLDDANKSKAKIESDYSKARKDLLSLRDRVRELDKNGSSNELSKLRSEYDAKLNAEITHNKELLAEISRAKDQLIDKERTISNLKEKCSNLENKSWEQVAPGEREELQTLRQKVQHMSEQISSLLAKLQKAKDFIRKQDQEIRDLKSATPSAQGHVDEAVTSIKAELRINQEEREKLQRQLQEERVNWKREQQLMLSAWHNVGRRYLREGTANSSGTPMSWLGQQRQALENSFRTR